MILEEQLPELAVYKKVERQLPLVTNSDYSKFVVSNGNGELPVHRWFRFKEGFSAGLLKETLETIIPCLGKKIRLLDPFCGVGTSLVASQEISGAGYDIEAIGIEQNPFIAFVARTKIWWPEVDALGLVNLGERVIRDAERYSPRIPPLSSLTTGRCVSRYLSQRVLAIRTAINLDGQSASHDAILLGLAAAIEPVSRVRKDGRALRFVQRQRQNLSAVLREKWATIASDVKFLQNTLPTAGVPRVILGDGRRPSEVGIEAGSIDLVLTSPPYPNNIDYSEVYKLELWLLGFVGEAEAFLRLRRSTFRSHPTCSKPAPLPEFIEELRKGRLSSLLRPLLSRIEAIPEAWRRRVLLGYFSDMWLSLRELHRCLRKDGYAVLVVGNSLHGGSACPYVIPTDIVVATIGQCVGFRIEQVTIARDLKRRLVGNHFLRESLILLKKIDG